MAFAPTRGDAFAVAHDPGGRMTGKTLAAKFQIKDGYAVDVAGLADWEIVSNVVIDATWSALRVKPQ
jgi:hypothetical protein